MSTGIDLSILIGWKAILCFDESAASRINGWFKRDRCAVCAGVVLTKNGKKKIVALETLHQPTLQGNRRTSPHKYRTLQRQTMLGVDVGRCSQTGRVNGSNHS